MLVLDTFFALSDGNAFTCLYALLHVVDGYVTVRVANCHPVLLLFSEGAARDAVIGLDEKLWVLWIFECPEAQETRLKLVLVRAVDIVLTIGYANEVRVG